MIDSSPPRTRRHRPPARLLVAALAAVTLGLSACGSGSDGGSTDDANAGSDAAAVRGGTLTLAVGADPISLNPQGGGSGTDPMGANLVDTLTAQDPKTGKLRPWLAREWTVNDNATQFTFTLREGVTFSDGSALTAEVFKQNFDDIVKNGAKADSAIAQFLGYDRTTVVDRDTFRVEFKQPNVAFLQATSTKALGPLAPATLALPFEDRARKVIGTGPFVLDHYTPKSEVVLTKRAGYAWPAPTRTNTGEAYLDKVIFRIVPEASVRTGSLVSGQIAGIVDVPPQDTDTLRGRGFQLLTRANPGIPLSLYTNVSHRPLDEVRVRRAIARALDPEQVRAAALSSDFKVATSSLSATTPGWTDLSEQIKRDRDEAGRLLDEAGWRRGPDGIRQKDGRRLALTLGYAPFFAPSQTAVEEIQVQLREVGIGVDLQLLTNPSIPAGQTAGYYDLTFGNQSRADADLLRTTFSTEGTNAYRLADPELERLLQDQRAAADPTNRDKILAQLQRRLVDQSYLIPLIEFTTVIATAKDVHGVSQGADSRIAPLNDVFLTH
ncbi:ABC-type dipeptide transport system, periplasmic component [Frankia sp. QA3]|nr:ABC-type dipeptide transport system, periplasmic component [Frankia sp. QA3]